MSGQRANLYPPKGDVYGPPVSVDEEIAVYDGDTGKVIKASGMTISGLISSIYLNVDGGSPDSVYGGVPSPLDGGSP